MAVARIATAVVLSLIVVVLITILVLQWIGEPATSARDRLGRHGGGKERFSQLDGLRSVKNEAFAPYVREYFCHSPTTAEGSVMFTPSTADVACVTMSESVRDLVECDRAHIDSVSVRDTHIVNMPGHGTCNSLLSSKQPSDETDADVRILNGIYRLTKSCVSIPFERLASTSTSDGSDDEIELELLSTDPIAIFVILHRPILLGTDASHLYAIDYTRSSPTLKLFRGLDAEDNRRRTGGERGITLILKRVDNPQIAIDPDAKGLTDVYDNDGVDDPDDPGNGNDDKMLRTMNATLFYLRYRGPLEIGTVRLRFDVQRAITMVFPLSRASQGKLFDSRGSSEPRIRLKVDSASTRAVLKLGDPNSSAAYNIDVHDRGYLVIIYSVDTLTMCYMSRERVYIRRENGVGDLNIERPELFLSNVTSAGARVPPICHPANTFSLANLYDMYIRLVSFS